MRRSILVAAMAGTVLALSAAAAAAQSIDYGTLEDMFGEPITTSVTGSPQRASDVPASMTIITADEIRRSGDDDIPGILRHVAGIDVLQWTNDQADVAVRGYNRSYSPRLLVLIDGRQLYTDYYGYTPWSLLPVALSDIRQIEVIRGPNSALFGFNAAAGVINIITYNPLFDDIDTASVRGGTQNTVSGSFVVTHRFADRLGVRLTATGTSRNDFSTEQRPVDLGTREGDRRFGADLNATLRLDDKTYASLDISHSESRQPEMTAIYLMFYTRYRTSTVKADLSSDTDWGLFKFSAYATWLQVNSFVSSLPNLRYPYENATYVAQLSDIFKIGPAHTFRLSAEYRYNTITTSPIIGADVFHDLVSGGAMWEWAITPDLSLTNAVRVDYLDLGRSGVIPPGYGLTNADWNNRSITEPSFNSGLVWRVGDEDTLRFTVARGAQTPNLLDLGAFLAATPAGYGAGWPFLEPAVVMNYEFAWTRALPSLNGEFIFRAFHQTNRDLIATLGRTALQLGLRTTPVNVGSSKTTGFELVLKGTIDDDWRWGLSYTPQVIDDHFFPGYTVANTLADYEHTQPVHVVNANLGWSGGPWEVDGYLRYESQFYGILAGDPQQALGRLVRIPDYASVDARLAYRFNEHVTLAVSGQNLLQTPQRQTSAPAVERRVFVTASVDF